MNVLDAASKSTKSIITAPNLVQPAPDKHLIGLQKQGFSANQERNSYQPHDIKIQNKVNFAIQPTKPQADIVAIGRCGYWITDIDIMKHQGNDTESPSDDPILPEVWRDWTYTDGSLKQHEEGQDTGSGV